MKIRVRPASQADVPALLDLYTELHPESYGFRAVAQGYRLYLG